MIYVLFAIFAGITVTLQNSINGLMAPVVGAIGASFLSFTTQATLIFAYLTLIQHRLPSIRRARFPEALSGPLAMVVVGLIGVCVSRMGSAVTTCCSVAGQIIISAVIDHFGLFNAQIMRFKSRRIPGFILILIGVLSINLIGASDGMKTPLPMLLLKRARSSTSMPGTRSSRASSRSTTPCPRASLSTGLSIPLTVAFTRTSWTRLC